MITIIGKYFDVKRGDLKIQREFRDADFGNSDIWEAPISISSLVFHFEDHEEHDRKSGVSVPASICLIPGSKK